MIYLNNFIFTNKYFDSDVYEVPIKSYLDDRFYLPLMTNITKINNLKYKKGKGFVLARKPKKIKQTDKQKNHQFIIGFINYHKKYAKEICLD